jgi:glutamate carboxypeptidase
MKALVEIESGSTNRAGLDKLSALISDRLKALGGEEQFVEPAAADI